MYGLFEIIDHNRWKKKRKVGSEGTLKGGFYGKSMFRIDAKSKMTRHEPAIPTSTTLKSGDGRTAYRVWSDGSYRKMVEIKGIETDTWRIKWKLTEALYGKDYQMTVIK